MSRTEYQKAYRLLHKEKLNAYKKAWQRMKRGSKLSWDFPEEIKIVSRGQFKPRKPKRIPKGRCQRCSSILKKGRLCDWCKKQQGVSPLF